MRIRQLFSIVPKAVQLWAVVIVDCAVLIGLVVGYQAADQGARLRTMSLDGSAALLVGIVIATWLLCLGFVFADARRRAMRPVLWSLVAGLFPHLLGFLLYFVMRQAIASTCIHCRQTIALYQRFCSWCGNPKISSTPGEVRLAADQC
jgi:hypothetical protein